MVIIKENKEDDNENSDHFTLTNESERIFKTVRVRKLTSMTELLENSIIHQVGLFIGLFIHLQLPLCQQLLLDSFCC